MSVPPLKARSDELRKDAKMEALIHRMVTDIATAGDLEAVRQLLADRGFVTLSADLFKLADAARAHLNRKA